MRYRILLLAACVCAAFPQSLGAQQQQACSDSIYVALKRIPVDSLTARQYEMFRERDIACVRARETPAKVSADDPLKRRGWFIGFDIGSGSATSDCPRCVASAADPDRPVQEGNVSVAVRFGHSLGDRVLLGVEGQSWGDAEELEISGGFWMLQLYPRQWNNLFLRGGLGVVIATHPREDRSTDDVIRSSGTLAAIGGDIRFGVRFVLTPTLTWVQSLEGGNINHQASNPFPTTARPSFVTFGVGFQWLALGR